MSNMTGTEFHRWLGTLPPNHPARQGLEPEIRAAGAAPRKPAAKVEPGRTSPAVLSIEVEVELRTKTECNTGEQPWDKAKRAKWQRAMVDDALRAMVLPALPVVVSLHRIGKGLLDAHDNLASSQKHVADSIAALYGVQDNDPRITWATPTQEKAKRFAVRIGITRRTA